MKSNIMRLIDEGLRKLAALSRTKRCKAGNLSLGEVVEFSSVRTLYEDKMWRESQRSFYQCPRRSGKFYAALDFARLYPTVQLFHSDGYASMFYCVTPEPFVVFDSEPLGVPGYSWWYEGE